jgi:hypothetical protein
VTREFFFPPQMIDRLEHIVERLNGVDRDRAAGKPIPLGLVPYEGRIWSICRPLPPLPHAETCHECRHLLDHLNK